MQSAQQGARLRRLARPSAPSPRAGRTILLCHLVQLQVVNSVKQVNEQVPFLLILGKQVVLTGTPRIKILAKLGALRPEIGGFV